ncbi:MAG: hypothetical protein JRI68_22935, partial [Deltaproteobacteria bacterium]|nr:hypothetical protein [Deltaproteobacteria bacterium]
DFRLELQGTYSPREYCVQYSDSAWDFLSRLMEEAGLFCFLWAFQSSGTKVIW